MSIKNLGPYIKKLREAKGYSQRKLARLSGVSNTAISKIEANLREDVSIEILSKLASELDVPITDLLAIQGYIRKDQVRIGDSLADIVMTNGKDFVVLEEKFGKVTALISCKDEWLETAIRVAQEMPTKDREKVIEYATMLLDKAKKERS